TGNEMYKEIGDYPLASCVASKLSRLKLSRLLCYATIPSQHLGLVCLSLLQLNIYLSYTLATIDIKIEMSRVISDIEIQQLLAEPKPLSPNWENRLRLTPKAQEAFSQRSLPLQLSNGHEFSLVLRGNRLSPLDFSVILVFKDIDGSEYILRRHNGTHPSRHTNEYEKRLSLPNAELPICFHRHLATERYQKVGLRIDGYAERTDDYIDIRTAQDAMIRDAGFVLPPVIQLPMLGDN
ncbi:MAG: hypothetical protein Q8N56_03325, partial [bacterium]|nr:hypothetical protein [bacterium]